MNTTLKLTCTLVLCCGLSAAAQESYSDGAAGRAPADVIRFHSIMNLGPMCERAASSDLVSRLCEIEYIGAVVRQYQKATSEATSDDAEAGEAEVFNEFQLAKNLLGREVFVYLESSFAQAHRKYDLLAQRAAVDGKRLPGEVVFLTTPEAELMDLPVPSFVVGCRLPDQETAEQYFQFVQSLATSPFAPAWIADGLEVLDRDQPAMRWRLRSDAIPWQHNEDASDVQRQATEKFIKLLDRRELSVTLAVAGEFLLASFGEGTGPIDRFGKSDETLWRCEAMQTARQADMQHPLTLGYVSDDWAAITSKSESTLLGWVGEFLQDNPTLVSSTDLNTFAWLQATVASTADSIQSIDRRWKQLAVPDVGRVSWSQLDESGISGRTIHHGPTSGRRRDATAEVLRHTGNDPVAVYASAGAADDRYWRLLSEVLQSGLGNDGFIASMLMASADESPGDAEARAKANAIRQRVAEIGLTLVDAGGTSLGDSGWAIILASDAADSPLPLQLAWVHSVGDREKLVQAGEDFRTQFNALIHQYAELPDDDADGDATQDEIPQLPSPSATATDHDTRYRWPMPFDFIEEIDDASSPLLRLAPQFVLSDQWLSLGISDTITRQIAEETAPIALPMTDFEGTMLSYVHVNIDRFLDAMRRPIIETSQGKAAFMLLGPLPVPLNTSAIGQTLALDDEDAQREDTQESSDAPSADPNILISPQDDMPALRAEDLEKLIDTLRTIRHYTRVTTARGNQTHVRWRLKMD